MTVQPLLCLQQGQGAVISTVCAATTVPAEGCCGSMSTPACSVKRVGVSAGCEGLRGTW